MQDYSIWFLECSYVNFPIHLTKLGWDSGRDIMPHGYYYLEGNGRKIMLDVGWSYDSNGKKLMDMYETRNFHQPRETLAQIGVTPEEIDTVILTHAHLDHAGATDDFPNAVFYIQEKELYESIRIMTLPNRFKCMASSVNPDDIVRLVTLAGQGRLVLLNGDVKEVVPAIDVHAAFDGHAPGHQFIRIRNEGGDRKSWICCGDLIFRYENITGHDNDGVYLPIVNGLPDMWTLGGIYDRMMQILENEVHRVLPMHVKEVEEIYPSKEWSEHLHVVEIQLAEGVQSRL